MENKILTAEEKVHKFGDLFFPNLYLFTIFVIIQHEYKGAIRVFFEAIQCAPLPGFCGHKARISDYEIHQHYNEMLRSQDPHLFMRITN